MFGNAQVCEVREQKLDPVEMLFWGIRISLSDMFGGAQVCELREKRLDQEEMLAEFQKAADTLKKDQEALMKKEKIIDQALKQTDDEIQQFQTFKQQKLNEIQVIGSYHVMIQSTCHVPLSITPSYRLYASYLSRTESCHVMCHCLSRPHIPYIISLTSYP